MNTLIKRRRWIWIAMTGLVVAAVLLMASPVWAFEGRTGDVLVIDADEVIEDDLYVGARSFTLNGTVQGDLVIGAQNVVINGTVEGDVIAAAQNIEINGTVEDDVRIAGYAMVVTNGVGDDLLAAGFSLDLQEEASVGGDLVYGGYQLVLAGEVAEDAKVGGGAVEISGVVGGDVTADVSSEEPTGEMPTWIPTWPGQPPVPSVRLGLTVTDDARIGGDLTYTANERVDIPDEAVAGEESFNEYVPPERGEEEWEGLPSWSMAKWRRPSPAALTALWFVWQVRRLVTLLLVGALMMWWVPEWTRDLGDWIRRKPLPSLGWGFVAIAAFLVGMVALFIATVLLALLFGLVTLGELAGTIGGLGFLTMGAAGFGFSVAWTYVSKIVISLLIGRLIFSAFKSPAARNRWWSMVLGVFIFVVITAIPILGWLARIFAAIFGLGAIWLWARDMRRGPIGVETG